MLTKYQQHIAIRNWQHKTLNQNTLSMDQSIFTNIPDRRVCFSLEIFVPPFPFEENLQTFYHLESRRAKVHQHCAVLFTFEFEKVPTRSQGFKESTDSSTDICDTTVTVFSRHICVLTFCCGWLGSPPRSTSGISS